jgi:TonB family protein
MTAANFLAYAAQVTIVVVACAGLPRLLGLRTPGLQYAFWRTVLVVCLLLPIVQPWQPHVMTFVPAPDEGGLAAPRPPTPGPPAAARQAPPFDWAAAVGLVLAGGVVARLAWIGLGMIRLRRMRRRATEAAFGFDDLQQAIGVRVPILWSSDVRHPVTFGVLEPVVLLPIALKSADLPAQRAVVAHELNHAKRRDWVWVVAEEVVRSLFWFHPAIWWLVSRVQLARETVVDELSILVTNARRTYLDTLLAFADDTGLASPPAFSARRHLFHRIMLLSKEGEMSSIRVAIGSCVLVLALGGGTVGAVTAFPLYGGVQDQRPPRDRPYVGHRMNADFEDADLRTVLRVFAKESGLNFVIDPEIQGRVNVRLNNMPWDQALDEILRSHKLGYTIEGNILRIAPLKVVGDEQSQLQASMPSPPPPPPPPADEWAEYRALIDQYNPVRVGGNIRVPIKTRDVKPVYPPLAQSANVQGVVILEAILDANGSVAAARILRSIPLLDQAALIAVRQWQFTPTLVDGVPRAVMMTVTVNFSLQ